MEARFDGWCKACASAIDAGDEIVNDDGEWVHEECAADEAEDTDSGDILADVMGTSTAVAASDPADRTAARRKAAGYGPYETLTEGVRDPATLAYAARVVEEREAALRDEVPMTAPAAQPEVKRDRYGRYVLKHPTKNRRGPLSRCTTVVAAADDTYALGEWKKGNVALGMARRADLLALAAVLKPGDRRLRKLVEAAEEAGGGSEAASLGTALHGFTEAIDLGGSLAGVPEDHRDDVIAYMEALVRYRLTIVPAAIERVTMTSRWDGVAGTFDRIYRLVDGSYVVGDIKSGKVGYDPKKMFAQLAVYAEGVNEVGVYDVAGERWERLPFEVRTDLGLIVHIPAGEGACHVYEADLEVGRHHVEFCAAVRRHRKLKHPLAPRSISRYTEDEWFERIVLASTRDSLVVVGRLINEDGAMTDGLRAAARDRIAELSDGA
jgi:hypothetical protein